MNSWIGIRQFVRGVSSNTIYLWLKYNSMESLLLKTNSSNGIIQGRSWSSLTSVAVIARGLGDLARGLAGVSSDHIWRSLVILVFLNHCNHTWATRKNTMLVCIADVTQSNYAGFVFPHGIHWIPRLAAEGISLAKDIGLHEPGFCTIRIGALSLDATDGTVGFCVIWALFVVEVILVTDFAEVVAKIPRRVVLLCAPPTCLISNTTVQFDQDIIEC